MNLTSKLDKVANEIAAGRIGSSEPWGGADVVICEAAPRKSQGGFYPEPRYVETLHVGEVSWMFEKIRDIFNDQAGYGSWKEELFGRLGNVVRSQTTRDSGATSEHLVATLLHEGYALAEELEDFGEIHTLMITSDNQILDDFVHKSEKSAMLSPAESLSLLESLMGES